MNNADKPTFPIDSQSTSEHYHGLTKREYLAAMVMQGICAKASDDKYHVNDGWLHPETVAKNAIQLADELLKQLEQNP